MRFVPSAPWCFEHTKIAMLNRGKEATNQSLVPFNVGIGIQLVDVDSGDSRVIRIVVEQIQKIHVSEHVVVDGDDLVNDDTRACALLRHLAKELSQCGGTVANKGVVLNVSRAQILGCSLLRLLLVDHQFIQAKNDVLVTNGAAIIAVYEFDHDESFWREVVFS